MLAVAAISLAACGTSAGSGVTTTTEGATQQGAETKAKPSVTVSPKTTASNVVLSSVYLPEGAGPGDGGWVVVGTDSAGKLASVLGATKINEGVSANVTVHVSPALGSGTYLVALATGTSRPVAGATWKLTKPFTVKAG